MEFLNIGLPELAFILLLALILVGPRDMSKYARLAGRWLYRFFKSPLWNTIRDTTREIQDMPTRIIREAGLEEALNDTSQELRTLQKGIAEDIKTGDGAQLPEGSPLPNGSLPPDGDSVWPEQTIRPPGLPVAPPAQGDEPPDSAPLENTPDPKL